MTLGDAAVPGAVRRVAIAVTHGESPQVVLAADETVLNRAVALFVVAATSPSMIDPASVGAIRTALLEERWSDAVLMWMDATGQVLDGYPDEPVWSDKQLDDERASMELRLAPIFND